MMNYKIKRDEYIHFNNWRVLNNRIIITCMLFCLIVHQNVYSQQNAEPIVWGTWSTWGDTGNGIYRNPVLPADYSDIDCIRVGIDYYAISSTFQYSPGVIILHSRDLVNWEILGHAVNDLSQISSEMNWDKMNRYGRGIWAGAIRYHDKKFWIYFGTPDEGYFMTTAKNPKGPWSPLHSVLAQKGWDDCSPFWDDDGQGYLVGTNFSDGYKIHLFKMTADGKALISGSDKVIHQSKGSEANKLYKINGMYYHLFSEVKAEGRAIMMERSKNIYGPYTVIKQLSYAQRQFNEPNQGGLVQTKKGKWYFLTHHGTGDWSGRVVSLLPVNWIDNWPVIGRAGPDKIGRMEWSGHMPVKIRQKLVIQTSDDFISDLLSPQWEWNYQPLAAKWSLTERKGWIRLKAFKPLATNDLLKAGNTLTQRSFRTFVNSVIVKFDLSGMTDGQKTGLAHYGAPKYASIGVVKEGVTQRLELEVNGKIKESKTFPGNNVWLKSTWGLDGKSRFFFSVDSTSYTAFGDVYPLTWGAYRGDRIALYNYNNKTNSGYVDIDYFHYSYLEN